MPFNNKSYQRYLYVTACVLLVTFGLNVAVWANPFSGALDKTKENSKGLADAKNVSAVELEADKVGFSQVDNVATAEGKVVVTSGKEKLYADKVVIDRTKQEASAEGNVYLDSPAQQVDADGLHYNFSNKTGHFDNARVFTDPFQIKGPAIDKVSDSHYTMDNGYMTTCDHDVPHFRMQMRRMDYYQGDKAVAHGVKMYLGKVPVMYMPRYTQDLRNKPWFTFEPGASKDLGFYLLTRSRIYSDDHLTTTLRLDAYERQGVAWGMDNKYKTDNYGSGIVKNYFINERSIAAHHPWQTKTASTTVNERYKLEWRHKWDVNDRTNTIWQYYRLSDDTLLKKYFKREFRRDPSADTFFLLTHNLPHGSLTFRVDHRVNRFVSAIDRTPEIRYENSGQEIGETNLYVKTTDTYSNLVYRAASPTEDRRKTQRFDTNNELYYPMKVAFIQARPFVGGEHTYYSRAIEPHHNNTVRGIFRTGADLSTKFYRMWNYKTDVLGVKINQLRHVVTPTAAYIYQHRPTLASSNLNQFDAIDSLDRRHAVDLGIENKLQTKRDKKTVDLLRFLASSEFALKENPGRGGFGLYKGDLEFTPTDRVKFDSQVEYDHYNGHISTANFETYVNGGEKWGFSLGRRYTRDVDDQITTQWDYKINPKWKFKVYDRFLANNGQLKEEQYTLIRDLHEWEMEFSYRQERGSGSEVLLLFRLKAFPDMDLNFFNTSFHRRKAGSQTGEGP